MEAIIHFHISFKLTPNRQLPSASSRFSGCVSELFSSCTVHWVPSGFLKGEHFHIKKHQIIFLEKT